MIELKFIIMSLCLFGSFFKFRPNLIISGIVTIENGKIVGNEQDNYVEFLGIPYADPPVDNLRFAAPQKYSEIWDDVRAMKNFSDVCAQYDHFGYKFHGSEDCLTLNVFVPKKVFYSNILVPVVCYIHGGAFMFGSGKLYGPKYLMQTQDVIVVTINYRLGVLGFLSGEDEVIPGNFGMKDQVEALKWIQRNIEAFNGDKSKVTISGFSAGGASVHLHYMSVTSDGLFNNGISHSGVATNAWVMMEKGREKLHDIASFLECPKDDHQATLECLRKKPTEDLVMLAKTYQPYLYNPFSPFGISVETEHDGAFLTRHPLNALESGSIRKLPWIMSLTQDEGLYPASEFYDDEILDTINNKWKDLFPFLFDYNSTTNNNKFKSEVTDKIHQHYLDNVTINKENFHKLLQIFTDRLYHSGAMKALQFHSKISPTYFYYFRYQKHPEASPLGVGHGDDVFLIFQDLESGENVIDNPEMHDMSNKLLSMYQTFSSSNQAVFGNKKMIEVSSRNIKCMEIFSTQNYSNAKLDKKFGEYKLWYNLNLRE